MSDSPSANERWRWVDGYEGLYMVSDRGRVMSVPKRAAKSNGYMVGYEGKLLQPAKNKKGYLIVGLSRDGELRTKAIHRLVAEAFLQNNDDYPCVNHMDEDKTNNHAENLEWCTFEYNNNYGTRNERISAATSRAVQMILDGKVVAEYPSARKAHEATGVTPSHVSECCNGKRKTANGFEWSYKEVL